MKMLMTSTAVRNAVTELMKPSKQRRVAIVAFVGKGAQTFIPQAKGVEIICWPNPGSTNPIELRKLIKMGARVRFADNLHMKVYWAARRGAVVTSANLSTNAMGSGSLKEIGVLLPAEAVNINAIIASTKSYPCTKANIRKLQIKDRAINVRGSRQPAPSKNIDFSEWYSLPLRSNSEWKLGWWEQDGKFAREGVEVAKSDYGKSTPHDGINCRAMDYQENDWVLCFRLRKNGASQVSWLFVNRVVRVNRKENEAFDDDYPYQAVQFHTPKHNRPPPFRLTSAFCTAFRKQSLVRGIERIRTAKSVIPAANFLKGIAMVFSDK